MPLRRQGINPRDHFCGAGIGFVRDSDGNPITALQNVFERQLAAYLECAAEAVCLFVFPICSWHHTGVNKPFGMERVSGRQAASKKSIAAGMRYRDGSQANLEPASLVKGEWWYSSDTTGLSIENSLENSVYPAATINSCAAEGE